MITFPTSMYVAMKYKIGFFFQEAMLANEITVNNPIPSFLIGVRPIDLVSATDTLTISYAKLISDGVQLTDALSLLITGRLSVNSSAVVADSGVLFIQDYCDFTYFALDYVGTSSTF